MEFRHFRVLKEHTVIQKSVSLARMCYLSSITESTGLVTSYSSRRPNKRFDCMYYPANSLQKRIHAQHTAETNVEYTRTCNDNGAKLLSQEKTGTKSNLECCVDTGRIIASTYESQTTRCCCFSLGSFFCFISYPVSSNFCGNP